MRSIVSKTTTTTTTTQGRFLSRMPIPLFASLVETTFRGRHDECRTRHGSRTAAKRATTARCLEARAAVDCHGLAELTHHTAPRGQRMARAGQWVRDALHGEAPEELTLGSPARGATTSTTTAAAPRPCTAFTPWSRSSIPLSPCRCSVLLCR